MNKKANIGDVVTTVGIVFMLILIVFFMMIILDRTHTAFQANNTTNYTAVLDDMDSFKDKYKNGWDYGILLIFILFPVFSFISARRINGDPKFMPIVIIILGMIVLFTMIISNIYGKMLDNATFATFMGTMPLSGFIMPFLPYYALIYMILVLYGLYTGEQV